MHGNNDCSIVSFGTKVVFYRQNIMIRCAAPVPLILNRNGCKYKMEKQRGPPDHKQRRVQS